MSHDDNNLERAASRHRPAIFAIAAAIIVAVLLYFVFPFGMDEQDEGIATTAPPEGTTITDAEGRDKESPIPVAPEGSAPVQDTE